MTTEISVQKIEVDENLCDNCGTCVAVCPHDAMYLSEFRLDIDSERCTLCMNCVYVCPVRALRGSDAE